MNTRGLVIAIDGPAASGKSTTARLVAKRLGYLHVDTGAMYRALTLRVLRAGVRPDDRDAVARLVKETQIMLERRGEGTRVLLDKRDVTEEIREPAVTKYVSTVSMFPEVRDALVRVQRQLGAKGKVVLEGRDIGTVVFPDADLKVFMIAQIEKRAQRRRDELFAKGLDVELESLKEDIARRDRLDTTRSESPLTKAVDAIEIDTSSTTIDEQVDLVVRKAEEILARSG